MCVISGPLAALNIIAKIMSANGQPNKPQQVDTVCGTQIAIPFVSTNNTLHLYIFTFRNETKCFHGETRTKNSILKTLQNMEVAKCRSKTCMKKYRELRPVLNMKCILSYLYDSGIQQN